LLQIRDLKFRYSDAEDISLSVDRLDITDGEMVLVCGPTGSGKTTLFRCLNALIPNFYGGQFGGHVTVDGVSTRNASPYSLSSAVGTVFQDPENQFIMLSAGEEIAFNLRNRGCTEEEVRAGIAEVVSLVEAGNLVEKSVVELSAGQKQRVAIASVAASRPKYVLLDEPTSQLDDQGTESLMNILLRLNRLGHTVIMSEHRIERVARHCSRFIVMDGGRIVVDGNLEAAGRWYAERGVSLFIPDNHVSHARRSSAPEKGSEGAMLSVRDLVVSIEGQRILDSVGISVARGELAILTGRNGSGKTTLLKSIMNFIPREGGTTVVDGTDVTHLKPTDISRHAAYLGHNPLSYLFHETLLDELIFSAKYTCAATDPGILREKAMAVASQLGIGHMAERFPRELSSGEREVAAIACTLVGGRKLILLDEPTRGMDYWKKEKFMSLLSRLSSDYSLSVLMTTHDQFLLPHADSVYRLEDGKIAGIFPEGPRDAEHC
jgi:energy-coupling factor transporter ATP-binding protein EcfA2